MAELQAALRQLVECPICYEVYTQPMALPCLHTLCEGCMGQVASWNASIRCPLCSKQYRTTDIVADFRVRELVDLFFTQEFGANFSNLILNDERKDHGGSGAGNGTSAVATPAGSDIATINLQKLFQFDLDKAKITQFLCHNDKYWFVLNTGLVVKYKSGSERTKVVAVREKGGFSKSLMSGLMAGLAASPLGPVAAVVAGVTTTGAMLAFTSDLVPQTNVSHRVLCLAACETTGELLAICEIKSRRGSYETHLMRLNQSLKLESTLCELQGGRLDVDRLEVMKGVVYVTQSGGRKISTFINDKLNTMSGPRHAKPEVVTRCTDGTHSYSNDGRTIYKFTSYLEIVAAYNIPAKYRGQLVFCCARKGRVVLQIRRDKSLLVLDTHAQEPAWTQLCIPDAEWKPVVVTMDDSCQVTVLCQRIRDRENCVYRCGLAPSNN